MGHIKFDNLVIIIKIQAIQDIPKIRNPLQLVCIHFQHGKLKRVNLKGKENYTSILLKLVHTDLCGPTKIKGLKGEHYFALFIDEFTRMMWAFLLNKKYETFECFKVLNFFLGNEIDQKLNV